MMKSDEVKAYAMLVAGAIGLFVLWKTVNGVKSISDGVSEGLSKATQYVTDTADRVWNGPADSAQSYDQLLTATKADTSLNPFTNNPNNVNPVDLIPKGYTVNQWGGLVYNSTAINSAARDDAAKVEAWTGGATGRW